MVNKNYGMLTKEHNCLIENKILGLKWDKSEDNLFLNLLKFEKNLMLYPPSLMLSKQ